MKRFFLVLGGVACVGLGFAGVYALEYRAAQHDRHIYSLADELLPRALGEGTITPLSEPQITTMRDADNTLRDEFWGVDVELSGQHRFYPLALLWWHEVINDTLGGEYLAVTFSPLSGSLAVYYRAEGEEYAASPFVYRSTTVLQVTHDNRLIDQLTGKELRSSTTTRPPLVALPYTLMTWRAWKETYPYGSVVSFKTGLDVDYTHHPYGNAYERNETIFFPVSSSDTRLTLKELVYGVQTDEGVKVFVHDDLVKGTVLTTPAVLSEQSGDLHAVLSEGVVRITFVTEEETRAVRYTRAMALAYLAAYPESVIVEKK